MIHEQLLEVLLLGWETIPHNYFGNLWHFMPSGVVGLAGAEGLLAEFSYYYHSHYLN